MVDRLNGISIFVQAAAAGSFTKAAERLGSTRSAVGKAIARLEERLATRLFQRTTRGQSLTDRGREFYERCLNIMAELEAAEASLEGERAAPAGLLRVTAPVLLGRQCVAPILIDLLRRHARLEIDLHFSDQFVDLVEERFDLAVRIGPLPDRAGLIARRLGTFDMVVCAAPSYLATCGEPASPEDLLQRECLSYSRRDGRLEPWRLRSPSGSVVEIAATGRIRLNDLDAIVDAAAAGHGLTCQPNWLLKRHLRERTLMPVLTNCRAIGNDVYAVRPQAPYLPARVRVAIDELAARMPRLLAGPS